MKARIFAAAALAVALAVAASTASAHTHSTSEARGEQDHGLAPGRCTAGLAGPRRRGERSVPGRSIPGVDVDVQYQTWPDHLQKFDATLAGNNAPDVIELGNTEMTKYMAAGAFATSRPTSFPELEAPGSRASRPRARYNGKIYGVPYYAGARVVIYRKDLYAAGRAQGPDEPRRSSTPTGGSS